MTTVKELRRSVYSFSGNHAARTFIWVVTISRIPYRQTKNPASHAQILANPASQRAVKSRFPSRYFAFSRIPHRTLVKSRIPRIPFQTLYMTCQLCVLTVFWMAKTLKPCVAHNRGYITIIPTSLGGLVSYL